MQFYIKKPNQPLPESLTDMLIDDCMTYLFERLSVRSCFNSTITGKCINIDFNELDDWYYGNENNLPIMILFIQTLLSRTPKGEAVMPFLDVRVKALFQQCDEGNISWIWSKSFSESSGELGYQKAVTPQTLDHLLFNSFVEGLRTGQSFENALQVINKIYLQNV